MRVLCRSGHFAFYPRKSSDISRFSNYFDVDLVREEDYYTFEKLAGADKYSILGKPYINLPAFTTYEGNVWDVMRENNFVYHIATGLILPKLAVIGIADISQVGYYFITPSALLQPGMRVKSGQQVMSYSAEFVEEGFALRILDYTYE